MNHPWLLMEPPTRERWRVRGLVLRILSRRTNSELADYYYGDGKNKAGGLAYYSHFKGCPV